MKAAIFVDISDLFYYINRRFRHRRLDYVKYYNIVQEEFGEILQASAYCSEDGDEVKPFLDCLKYIGYEVKYKKPTYWMKWTAGISMDIVRFVDNVDVVVIGSSDANLVDVVKYVKERGKKCIVFACCISREMKEAASRYIEINGQMLEGVGVETSNTTE